MFEKKKRRSAEEHPNEIAYKRHFFTAVTVFLPFPTPSSSETRRIQARLIPDVESVTAKRYALIISEKSPIPSAPIRLDTYALNSTDTIFMKIDAEDKIKMFSANFFNRFTLDTFEDLVYNICI